MNKKRILSAAALLFVFAAVFLGTFFYKGFKSSGLDKDLNLTQLSQHLNEVGYVGWELLLCADDDRCPPGYDPQSAMSLMPLVKMAEDESFVEILKASKDSKSLSGLMDGMAQCAEYCSCVVWERFLASEFGKDFQVDFNRNDNDGTCQPWELLSEVEKATVLKTLNYIESLQN